MDIRSHFEGEIGLKKKIFEVEESIDTLGFTMFKAMNEQKKLTSNKDKQLMEEKIEKYRDAMNDLRTKKDEILE